MPEALRQVGIKVECLKDHFKGDTPDWEWIPRCAERGWLIITSDKGIERDPENYRALLACKAKVVLLDEGRHKGIEWAAALIVSRHYLGHLITAHQEHSVVVSLKNSASLVHHPRAAIHESQQLIREQQGVNSINP